MKQIVAGVSIVLLTISGARAMQVPSDDVLARVDHLVYTTPDLELGIQAIEKLTGVRASADAISTARSCTSSTVVFAANEIPRDATSSCSQSMST